MGYGDIQVAAPEESTTVSSTIVGLSLDQARFTPEVAMSRGDLFWYVRRNRDLRPIRNLMVMLEDAGKPCFEGYSLLRVAW